MESLESFEGKKRKGPIDSLYQFIQTLRYTAVMKYEGEKAKGTPDPEISEKLKPVIDKLAEAEESSVRSDFDGVAHAIIQFEMNAVAFREHASLLMKKAEDSAAHATKLKELVKNDMLGSNESQRRGLCYTACLIEITSKGGSRGVTIVIR